MQHTYNVFDFKKSFSKRDTFSLKLVYIVITTLNLSLISSFNFIHIRNIKNHRFKPDISKLLQFEFMCVCGEFTKVICSRIIFIKNINQNFLEQK